ncbi:hypothetical protein [uncultured Nostoc sp.]|uniref:hypothetical protein n=1 Tax=uncultured Nostoc sp. TaxID=340711 RepID=UPI0035CB3971
MVALVYGNKKVQQFLLSALPRSKHPSRNRLKEPVRRTHATLLLERSPLRHWLMMVTPSLLSSSKIFGLIWR